MVLLNSVNLGGNLEILKGIPDGCIQLIYKEEN